MTAPAPEIVEQKQKAPSLKHAHCTLCQRGPGEVRALCGAAKQTGPPKPLVGPLIPPHACVVCSDLLLRDCQLCGGRAW